MSRRWQIFCRHNWEYRRAVYSDGRRDPGEAYCYNCGKARPLNSDEIPRVKWPDDEVALALKVFEERKLKEGAQ